MGPHGLECAVVGTIAFMWSPRRTGRRKERDLTDSIKTSSATSHPTGAPSNPSRATRRHVLLAGAGLATATVLGAPAIIRPARASTPVKGVVEMFTSQGCSSCPPADELLAELIASGEAVGLALHVDYWDYLGWKDPLASRANTRRQYAYAQAFQRRGVYTPQAVVNGRDHYVGSRERDVRLALDKELANGLAPALDVAIEERSGEARVAVNAGDAPARSASVVAMRYRIEHTEAIERGENRGRTITYHHPVLDFDTIGEWNGSAVEFAVPVGTPDVPGGLAVLVQDRLASGAPGPVLGAAAVRVGATG